jgi:hypothetical protein
MVYDGLFLQGCLTSAALTGKGSLLHHNRAVPVSVGTHACAASSRLLSVYLHHGATNALCGTMTFFL